MCGQVSTCMPSAQSPAGTPLLCSTSAQMALKPAHAGNLSGVATDCKGRHAFMCNRCSWHHRVHWNTTMGGEQGNCHWRRDVPPPREGWSSGPYRWTQTVEAGNPMIRTGELPPPREGGRQGRRGKRRQWKGRLSTAGSPCCMPGQR